MVIVPHQVHNPHMASIEFAHPEPRVPVISTPSRGKDAVHFASFVAPTIDYMTGKRLEGLDAAASRNHEIFLETAEENRPSRRAPIEHNDLVLRMLRGKSIVSGLVR